MCRGKKFLLIQVNGHGIMSLLLAKRQGIRHSGVMFIDPAQSEYYKTSRFINEKSTILHTILSLQKNPLKARIPILTEADIFSKHL